MNLHWFKNDLRLYENPSLYEASKDSKIITIYILDTFINNHFQFGEASRWWLHNSLKKLNESLNNNLCFYKGDPNKIIFEIVEKYKIKKVFWNRSYEPWQIKRDTKIKENLFKNNIEIKTFNSSLLWEPEYIKKDDSTPYKVFTPFYKKGCLKSNPPKIPLNNHPNLNCFKDDNSQTLNSLNLLPNFKWYSKLEKHWEVGEESARRSLKTFINTGLSNYKKGRNFPSKKNVSRLSPHIHFGEISINEIWYEIEKKKPNNNTDHFKSELGWREFSYNLLYFNHDLSTKNFQQKFDLFPWKYNKKKFSAWKKGLTGFPIVDAGMRELWETGYMHNRVRMIVGSFLVKNLLIDWRYGERWFWDCLVDADLANNSASWQWVAGSGADAAPYFRIFNPVIQGFKFDEDGKYTKKFVPELKNIPNKFLFNPWECPNEILEKSGVKLGGNYPKPIIDLKNSRNDALLSYQKIKK
tara:strand:- start:6212 stop:7612 length:1401 start_codon:yes stop_codon:yes gene_type:complete